MELRKIKKRCRERKREESRKNRNEKGKKGEIESRKQRTHKRII